MPTALQASISSVPAGAVTCLPSTVMVTFFTSAMMFNLFQRLPDFIYLSCVPFGVHGHCNQHFTDADHPSGRMRMFYLGCAQIFSVLLQELDNTGTSGLKLLRGFCQSGKSTNWVCAFRRFHLVNALRDHVQECLLAIRRVSKAWSALCADQLELDGLSGCQMLNRIKHGPAVRSRLQPTLFFSDTGKALKEYFAGLLKAIQKKLLVYHHGRRRIGLCAHI